MIVLPVGTILNQKQRVLLEISLDDKSQKRLFTAQTGEYVNETRMETIHFHLRGSKDVGLYSSTDL